MKAVEIQGEGQVPAIFAALCTSPATARAKAGIILAADCEAPEAGDHTTDDSAIACTFWD